MATIRDLIADAEDGFPTEEETSVTSTTDALATFFVEADDPEAIEAYTGFPPGYTAWLKLVVPEDAVVTMITVEEVVFELNLPVFVVMLFDEVPTTSSQPFYTADGAPPFDAFGEISLDTGTYYLLVAPYEGPDWDISEGSDVAIRVDWLETAFHYSLNAVIAQEQEASFGLDAVIAAVQATEDDFSLNAIVQKTVADDFGLDAVIASITTHARTGPHHGVTPDTAITLSSALGTLSAGDTLHDALRELDALISERERGE